MLAYYHLKICTSICVIGMHFFVNLCFADIHPTDQGRDYVGVEELMKIGWLKICNRYSIYHKIYFNSLNLDIQDILFIFKLVIYVLDRPILDTMYKVHFLFKLDIYHRNKRYPRCQKIIFSLLFFLYVEHLFFYQV